MFRGRGCLINFRLCPIWTYYILTETLYTWLEEQPTPLEDTITIMNIEGGLACSQTEVGEKEQLIHILDVFTDGLCR